MRASLAAILFVAMMGCANKMSMHEMEKKYGPLAEFTPKSGFVHFITVDSVQVDCIRHADETYQVLTTTQR